MDNGYQSRHDENIEEALSMIWGFIENKECEEETVTCAIKNNVSQDVYEKIKDAGYIKISAGKVELTREGEKLARKITRRHRLAERLLTDVLELRGEVIDNQACRFEHIISEDVVESICTLLGHPKQCPHGSPIPPGHCCEKSRENIESIVSPLDKKRAGYTGRVAYILTYDHPHLKKLMSLGLVPGSEIKLIQTSPGFVINVGETQIALEQDIAKEIYVRG
ncbi:MAG: metal-dependent transcriptional regulator [Elusimicrobiota bacterium]